MISAGRTAVFMNFMEFLPNLELVEPPFLRINKISWGAFIRRIINNDFNGVI